MGSGRGSHGKQGAIADRQSNNTTRHAAGALPCVKAFQEQLQGGCRRPSAGQAIVLVWRG